MTALKIKYVDVIITPTRLTFSCEDWASITEPHLLSEGCFDFRFPLGGGHYFILGYAGYLWVG
jgi:hypothetical protein